MKLANKTISALFVVKSGDFHAVKELDPGNVPLISCGDTDNGYIGNYDIPSDKQYRNTLTVAYNGQPLTTKYHPYTFGAKDDVGVLLPREEMTETTLLYIAGQLNKSKWRYSYGRKCFREKLKRFEVHVPVLKDGSIDQETIRMLYPDKLVSALPPQQRSRKTRIPELQWQEVGITTLFDIKRGDFHSIAALDPGEFQTVSRVTARNGVIGNYDKPEGATVYKKGTITVSTVGGDAFVQMQDFIATDNVLICIPKKKLRLTTLFFIANALNNQKWRYSYGRQPYKTKFDLSSISLPLRGRGLDEDAMETLVTNTSYWPVIKKALKV